MCSSHGMTRRELPRARGRRVSAIAWAAPGTISDWNATCHRRPVCPENPKLFINLTVFDFLLMLGW
jgi:hypothetical protein